MERWEHHAWHGSFSETFSCSHIYDRTGPSWNLFLPTQQFEVCLTIQPHKSVFFKGGSSFWLSFLLISSLVFYYCPFSIWQSQAQNQQRKKAEKSERKVIIDSLKSQTEN